MHHNYAFDYIETIIATSSASEIYIVIEDARKRKWYGDKANVKSQGAGAIKVICGFWAEWANNLLNAGPRNIAEIKFIHPLKGGTKKTSRDFKRITGWPGRTNEHMRDAGVIAYTYNPRLANVSQL